MNARTALPGIFVALTIVFASTTVYESGIRTTLTSTSTSTVTSTSVSTITTTSVSVSVVTTTSSANLTKPLTGAYLSHIGAIISDNATALASQYETNATLLFDSPNFNGSYSGSANIPYFYGRGFPGDLYSYQVATYSIAAANDTYSIAISNGLGVANVTSQLVFYGNDPECPVVTVDFQCASGTAIYFVMRFDISYVLHGDSWLISTESVTNNTSGFCYPVSLSADGSVLNCPTPSPS